MRGNEGRGPSNTVAECGTLWAGPGLPVPKGPPPAGIANSAVMATHPQSNAHTWHTEALWQPLMEFWAIVGNQKMRRKDASGQAGGYIAVTVVCSVPHW